MTATPPTASIENPYPGIRPFKEKESDRYFGREKHLEKLKEILQEHHFAAVIGPSGVGKTSFIHCGLFRELKKKEDWEILELKPGSNPLENLVNCLKPLSNHSISAALLQKEGHEDYLYKTLNQYNKPNKLLIYIDQFEELFRYEEGENKGFSDHEFNSINTKKFIEQIVYALDKIPDSGAKYHILISLRSDFIGSCSQYPDLTDWINLGQYLIPQMSQEDLRAAIEKPIYEFFNPTYGRDIKVKPELVDKIIQDMGEDYSLLPIMQQTLRLTFDYWAKSTNNDNQPIGLPHYDKIGGLKSALSNHAHQAYSKIEFNEHDIQDASSTPQKKNSLNILNLFNKDSKEVLIRKEELSEKIFKAITYTTHDGKKIRRPTSLEDLYEISSNKNGASHDHLVNKIVEEFVQDEVGLMTSNQDDLNNDTIIDISHESLITHWPKLNQWVSEEAESVKIYHRIVKAAKLRRHENGNLLRGSEVEIPYNWWISKNPTLDWARQYGTDEDYYLAKNFLFRSHKVNGLKQSYDEDSARKRLRTTRIFVLVMIGITLVAAFLAVRAYLDQIKAKEAEKEAIKARNEATALLQVAKDATKAAEDSARVARLQRERAREAQLAAIQSAQIADQEKEKALLDRKKAIVAKIKAMGANEAAQLSIFTAELKGIEAELSKLESNRLFLANLARTLASKSQAQKGVSKDPNLLELKALLAYQAYLFYRLSSNEQNLVLDNSEIYNGLYDALKSMQLERNGNVDFTKLLDLNYYPSKHMARVRKMVCAHEDMIYSVGEDGALIMWDTKTKRINKAAIVQGESSRKNDASPFGVNENAYNEINVLKQELDSLIASYTPGKDSILDTRVDNLRRNLAQVQDSLIKEADKKENNFFRDGAGLIHQSLAYHPQNNLLACGGKYPYLIFLNSQDLSINDTYTLDFQNKASEVWFLGFTPEGLLISAQKDWSLKNKIFLWELDGNQSFQLVDSLSIQSNLIAFKENLLAVSQNNSINIYSIENKKMNLRLSQKTRGALKSLAIKSNQLAYGNESGGLTLIDFDLNANGGESSEKESVIAHGLRINSISFSENGRLLATASDDEIVRIWDVQNVNSEPIKLDDHDSWVESVIFSENNNYVVAACRDELIRSWPTKTSDMANLLYDKKYLTRDFEEPEWRRFVNTTQKDDIDVLKYENRIQISPR